MFAVTASKFSPPKKLSFSGNLSENWSHRKKEFGFYVTATEATSKPDALGKDFKTSHSNREKGREVYYTFTFANEDEAMKYSKAIEKFDELRRTLRI